MDDHGQEFSFSGGVTLGSFPTHFICGGRGTGWKRFLPLVVVYLVMCQPLAVQGTDSEFQKAGLELEERGESLVLRNEGHKTFTAWVVQTVIRSELGAESSSSSSVDAYRDTLSSDGSGTLRPGQSITLEKPKVWLREDHRGPNVRITNRIGMAIDAEAEAVGDPELIEKFFASRRAEALVALSALDANEEEIRSLPWYAPLLDAVHPKDRALHEIRARAWEDYLVATNNLRPIDLELLSLEEAERKKVER